VGLGGCSDTAAFLTVEVTPPPRLEVVAEPDFPGELTLWSGQETVSVWLEEVGGEAVDWVWTLPDGRVAGGSALEHGFQAAGTWWFELAGVDAKGCWSDTVVGPVLVLDGSVTLSNVFTPNGDGINDVFRPEVVSDQPVLFQIYDRWGGLVFETRNRLEGWRGLDRRGNRVPAGTYFYRLRVGGQDFAGSVDLLR